MISARQQAYNRTYTSSACRRPSTNHFFVLMLLPPFRLLIFTTFGSRSLSSMTMMTSCVRTSRTEIVVPLTWLILYAGCPSCRTVVLMTLFLSKASSTGGEGLTRVTELSRDEYPFMVGCVDAAYRVVECTFSWFGEFPHSPRLGTIRFFHVAALFTLRSGWYQRIRIWLSPSFQSTTSIFEHCPGVKKRHLDD